MVMIKQLTDDGVCNLLWTMLTLLEHQYRHSIWHCHGSPPAQICSTSRQTLLYLCTSLQSGISPQALDTKRQQVNAEPTTNHRTLPNFSLLLFFLPTGLYTWDLSIGQYQILIVIITATQHVHMQLSYLIIRIFTLLPVALFHIPCHPHIP